MIVKTFTFPLLTLALAAIPAPDDAFAVKPIHRGPLDALGIDNLPTPQGLVDVVTPWGADWAIVRIGSGPWSSPVPINSLGTTQVPAVVSTTFCVSYPVTGPYGSVIGATEPQQFTVTAGGDGMSLEEAVSKVKAGIAAVNGFHVPCPKP